MNLNKVFIIGRLTQDPESRSTPSGQNVTTLNVATNRVWNADGGRKEATEFHRIVAWGKLGEVANNYLKKGGLVQIEGRLQTRSWVGKDNQKRYATEIVAEGLQLGPRSANTGGSYEPAAQAQGFRPKPQSTSQPAPADDIPIIDENEPLHAGIASGVDEDEMKITEKDLPF